MIHSHKKKNGVFTRKEHTNRWDTNWATGLTFYWSTGEWKNTALYVPVNKSLQKTHFKRKFGYLNEIRKKGQELVFF